MTLQNDEKYFLWAVRNIFNYIGYGRLMTIISRVWYLELKEEYGVGVGAFKPVCILIDDDAEIAAGIAGDPLFGGD